ncbi:MAG: M48 family metallopeptidase [Candidatus Sericytochromatia bacterium]
MFHFAALLFDPEQTRQSVQVAVAGDGLTLETAQGRQVWPYSQLELAWGGAETAQIICHWQGHTLYIGDLAFLEALQTRWPAARQAELQRLRQQTKPKRRWLPLVLVTAGVLGGLGWVGVLGALWVWNRSLEQVPVSWESKLGEMAYAELAKEQPVCSEAALQAGIDQVGKRLQAVVPDQRYTLQYEVHRSPEVNAAALPGGRILINAALVAEAPSAEALAGVMAHEAAHVLERHGLKSLIGKTGLTLAVPLLLGDLGSATVALGTAGAGLLDLGFSRRQESAADAAGLALLQQAEIAPRGMLAFFDWMQRREADKGTPPELLSTHPLSAERLARLREQVAALPALKERPLELDWPRLQRQAKACLGQSGSLKPE